MKALYDDFLQTISGTTWGQFVAQAQITQNSDGALAVKAIFQQDIYSYAFYYCLAIAGLASCFYYFVLNRKGGSGYGFKLRYWLCTLAVSATVILFLTTGTAYSMVKQFLNLHTFKFCLGLGVINAIYLTIAFLTLSLLLKRFSVANRTPF